MMKIKNLFSAPKKAFITSLILVVVFAMTITGISFSVLAVEESKSIGKENAQSSAFADAHIDPNVVDVSETKFKFKKGQYVFDVEFTVNGVEYDYVISAKDGTIIEREVEDHNLYTGVNQDILTRISAERAKEIALDHAALTASDVTFIKVELDHDDGRHIYDVEFYKDNTEYDYEIDAVTENIIKSEREVKNEHKEQGTGSQDNPSTYISAEQAKEIALNHATLTAEDVVFIKVELDHDDGRHVYDVEFYKDNTEYDYEIDAVTGSIIKSEREIENDHKEQGTGGQDKPSAYISAEQAKEIALNHANLTAADVTFIQAEFDHDDGVHVYDVEFYKGNTEYEYEIDAVTGTIRSCHFDIENHGTDKPQTPSNPGDAATIRVDQAKNIALTHAGFSSSEVTFIKAKFKNENKHKEYEIEFTKNGIEYEYTIDAITGAILEYDSEYDD